MCILQQEKKFLYLKIFKMILLQLILTHTILIKLFKSLIFNFIHLLFQEVNLTILNHSEFYKYLRILVNYNSKQTKLSFF